MPYNGSGTFNRPVSPYQGGTTVKSGDMNTEMDGMAVGLSTAVTKDGQTQPTANLPMNTRRHINVGDAVSIDEYATANQVSKSLITFGGVAADQPGGTAGNDISISPGVAVDALVEGAEYTYVAGPASNTGPMTIVVSGLPAVDLKTESGGMTGGEHISGKFQRIRYDGASFVLFTSSLQEDLNPGLGGNLRMNGKSLVSSAGGQPGGPLLAFTENTQVTDAVHVSIANSTATGNASISVAGGVGGGSPNLDLLAPNQGEIRARDPNDGGVRRIVTLRDYPRFDGVLSNQGSATNLSWVPFRGGNWLFVGGENRQVSTITLDITGATESTIYYVYAYMDGSTPKLEISTTAYTTIDGIKVKTGQTDRPLVGFIRTNSSGQLNDNDAYRGVVSEYNDPPKALWFRSGSLITITATALALVPGGPAVQCLLKNNDWLFGQPAGTVEDPYNGDAHFGITMDAASTGWPVAGGAVGISAGGLTPNGGSAVSWRENSAIAWRTLYLQAYKTGDNFNIGKTGKFETLAAISGGITPS